MCPSIFPHSGLPRELGRDQLRSYLLESGQYGEGVQGLLPDLRGGHLGLFQAPSGRVRRNSTGLRGSQDI